MSKNPLRAKTALEAVRGGGVATVIAPTPPKRRVGRFKGNLTGVWLRSCGRIRRTRENPVYFWILGVSHDLSERGIKMPIKDYQVDFFQVIVTATPTVPDPMSGFALLRGAGVVTISTAAGYTRDIWRVQHNATGHSYRGQLRKFRMSDFPEIGAVGGDGEELELDPNQGIIEKNFFQFEDRFNLLIWHSNGHASSAGQFARVLSDLWGTKVSFLPIPKAGAARRLLAGTVDISKLELSIPIPTDPSFYPANNFSREVIDMLRGASGDRIKIEISADSRKVGAGRVATLGRNLKRAIAELASEADASIARVDAIEDGVKYPIDLVAERIRSTQVIDHEGRYPGDQRMFEVLRAARNEVNAELEEYFGGEDRIDI